MEKNQSPDGFSVLGCAEVENESVLKIWLMNPKLKSRNLQIVHYDSPDKRGVDVALLYNPKYFTPKFSEPLFIDLRTPENPEYYTVTFSMFWHVSGRTYPYPRWSLAIHAEEAKRLLHHHVLRLLLYVKTKLIL